MSTTSTCTACFHKTATDEFVPYGMPEGTTVPTVFKEDEEGSFFIKQAGTSCVSAYGNVGDEYNLWCVANLVAAPSSDE